LQFNVISSVLNRIESVWKNREVGFRWWNIINGRALVSALELADFISKRSNTVTYRGLI